MINVGGFSILLHPGGNTKYSNVQLKLPSKFNTGGTLCSLSVDSLGTTYIPIMGYHAFKADDLQAWPQECSFSLCEKDQLEACSVYLEIVYTRIALMEPKTCVFCRQLRCLTLERCVVFVEKVLGTTNVAQHDHGKTWLLSESDGKDFRRHPHR